MGPPATIARLTAAVPGLVPAAEEALLPVPVPVPVPVPLPIPVPVPIPEC